MNRSCWASAALTLLVAVSHLSACSDISPTTAGPEAGPSGVGRVVIRLIDAPGDYEEVNIEFTRVDIRMDVDDTTSGWFSLCVDTTRVDLLELTDGNYTVLADSTVPAGRYTEVRLILSDNNTVKVNGTYYDLEVPSGSTSGLKLKHQFDVVNGVVYAITLDLDADRSVVRMGGRRYKLKPVIRLTVDAVSGAVNGRVLPVDARARIGTVVGEDTVVAWADTLTGAFLFPVLPAGTYALEITPTAGAYGDTVVSGVRVVAGMNTGVGTIELQ